MGNTLLYAENLNTLYSWPRYQMLNEGGDFFNMENSAGLF